jgi:hypothetical protein
LSGNRYSARASSPAQAARSTGSWYTSVLPLAVGVASTTSPIGVERFRAPGPGADRATAITAASERRGQRPRRRAGQPSAQRAGCPGSTSWWRKPSRSLPRRSGTRRGSAPADRRRRVGSGPARIGGVSRAVTHGALSVTRGEVRGRCFEAMVNGVVDAGGGRIACYPPRLTRASAALAPCRPCASPSRRSTPSAASSTLPTTGTASPWRCRRSARGRAIPARYLEQIFQRLRRAELVTGKRGPGGGYVLSRLAGGHHAARRRGGRRGARRSAGSPSTRRRLRRCRIGRRSCGRASPRASPACSPAITLEDLCRDARQASAVRRADVELTYVI